MRGIWSLILNGDVLPLPPSPSVCLLPSAFCLCFSCRLYRYADCLVVVELRGEFSGERGVFREIRGVMKVGVCLRELGSSSGVFKECFGKGSKGACLWKF